MAPRIHHVQQHHLPLPGLEAMSLLTKQHFSRHAHEQFGLGIFIRGAQRSWSHLGGLTPRPGRSLWSTREKCTMAYR